MILKDGICTVCGKELEVYVEFSFETSAEEFCPLCERIRTFETKCNGGTGSRWRMNDWDGYDPKGCIETLETSVGHYPTKEHADADKVEALPHKKHGTVNEWHKKFKDEREDQFRYKFNKKRDKVPKRFDMKKD